MDNKPLIIFFFVLVVLFFVGQGGYAASKKGGSNSFGDKQNSSEKKPAETEKGAKSNGATPAISATVTVPINIEEPKEIEPTPEIEPAKAVMKSDKLKRALIKSKPALEKDYINEVKGVSDIFQAQGLPEHGTKERKIDLLHLSLDDCVELALERNAKVRASGYEVEAAKGQLIEASATAWPVLEYDYKTAPVPNNLNDALTTFFKGQVTFFNSIRVGIGAPVVTFGQLSTVKRMAKGGVEAAKINEEKSIENTMYQVKQLYFGVQLAKETIKLLAEAVEKISERVVSEEQAEEKSLDPYDILQLKMTKVDLERRLDETKSNLELAMEGLRIQLDFDPYQEIGLDSDNLRPVSSSLASEEEYITKAMENHPDLRLLDIGLDVKRSQYKLEKFKLLPKAGVAFFVDVGRTTGSVQGTSITDDFTDPFNFTRAGIGLQLKGTIDFHGSYGRIKKAKAEYYKSTLEAIMARRALALDIRKSYLQAKRARDDMTRAKKAQSFAQQMMFMSKVNVDMGIGDNQRYADALKMLLLTRGSYFKAVFDYNMSFAELSQRVGMAKAALMFDKSKMTMFNLMNTKTMGFENYHDNAVTIEGLNNDDPVP